MDSIPDILTEVIVSADETFKVICYFKSIIHWIVRKGMMRAVEALETLELVGSGQWGLVTTAQGAQNGVSRVWMQRLCRQGALQRVRNGVYALPSALSGPLQDIRAAWLQASATRAATRQGGEENMAVVSGVSAAVVHQLGELVTSTYEFSTPGRRQTSQQDVRFQQRALDIDDIVWVEGLPVTSVPRTIQDLTESAIDFDHLATVVSDALGQSEVSAPEIARALNQRAPAYAARDGHELLARLLARTGASRSVTPTLSPDLLEAMRSTAETMTPGREEQLLATVSELVNAQVREALKPYHEQWKRSRAENLPEAPDRA